MYNYKDTEFQHLTSTSEWFGIRPSHCVATCSNKSTTHEMLTMEKGHLWVLFEVNFGKSRRPNKIGYRWIPDMMRYDEFMESSVLLKCQRFGQNKMPLALHSFADGSFEILKSLRPRLSRAATPVAWRQLAPTVDAAQQRSGIQRNPGLDTLGIRKPMETYGNHILFPAWSCLDMS